jgi:peptidoglycan/LPS O-acetylase OafA/YrhL
VCALAVVFALLIGLGTVIRPQADILEVATNPLLMEFVAGMGIGWLVRTKRFHATAGPMITAVALVLFLAGVLYGYRRLPSALSWGAPSALLVAGVVGIEIRSGASRLVQAVGRLGDSSYSLYLLHVLLITSAADLFSAVWVGGVPRPIPVSLVLAVVCVITSEVFHRMIEQPMLSRLNRRRHLPLA